MYAGRFPGRQELSPGVRRRDLADAPQSATPRIPFAPSGHMPSERHTWIIDVIEDDVAAIEEDGERIRHVPRWLLPPDAGEGAILSVERRVDEGGGTRLIIAIDASATDEKPRVRPRNLDDRGGDIAL